jgi:hypothetical protein
VGKLNVYDFGRELLKTNDLDPVYVAVHEARLEPDLLKAWLLAYWCFYHVGTASVIAESYKVGVFRTEANYFKAMREAAGSKEWPRSSERRHFRAANALKSVAFLEGKGLAALFAPFYEPAMYQGLTNYATAASVMKYVQTWVGFGPWIAFKVADMMERLGLCLIRFTESDALYDSPLKAAQQLWTTESPGRAEPFGVGSWAVGRVLGAVGPTMAPPTYNRLINVQEAETILCKWGSYMNGHYHLGEDVAAVRDGLLRFAKCRLSQRLLAGGKKGGLW